MCPELIVIYLRTYLVNAVFVEKLLRVQPEVKRLFLLIRAADAASAAQRLQNEVDFFELLST